MINKTKNYKFITKIGAQKTNVLVAYCGSLTLHALQEKWISLEEAKQLLDSCKAEVKGHQEKGTELRR